MKRELTRARKNERSVKKINEPIDLKTQSCATNNHNFIYHLHAFRFIQLHSAHSICILYLPRIYRYDILLPNIIASLRMQSIHRPTKICYKSTCDFFFIPKISARLERIFAVDVNLFTLHCIPFPLEYSHIEQRSFFQIQQQFEHFCSILSIFKIRTTEHFLENSTSACELLPIHTDQAQKLNLSETNRNT